MYTLRLSLSCHVKQYSCLVECIQQLEKEIAFVLSQTQGAFLSSIRGIGIVLAAGICSEIGDPFIQGSAASLASYAGVVPRVEQTGGAESEPWLKDALILKYILRDLVIPECQFRTLRDRSCHRLRRNHEHLLLKRLNRFQVEKTNSIGTGCVENDIGKKGLTFVWYSYPLFGRRHCRDTGDQNRT